MPNGGFEEYTVCPSSENTGVPDFLMYAGWKSKLYTPDYFNSCTTNTSVSTPKNFTGYQVPSSGNGYIGLFTYAGLNGRELAVAKLTQTLIVGVKYYLRMKVSPTLNNIGDIFNTFSNNVGMYLSTIEPDSVLKNYANLKSNSIINDTLNWAELFTAFVSDSTYQYITLGNQYNNNNTTILIDFSNTDNFGYTYIDDVCISTDSAFCKNFIQQGSNNIRNWELNQLKIYPNPIEDNVLYFSERLYERKISLVNDKGEIVLVIEKYSGSNLLLPEELQEGIYTLLIDGFISKRIILLQK